MKPSHLEGDSVIYLFNISSMLQLSGSEFNKIKLVSDTASQIDNPKVSDSKKKKKMWHRIESGADCRRGCVGLRPQRSHVQFSAESPFIVALSKSQFQISLGNGQKLIDLVHIKENNAHNPRERLMQYI